MLKLYNTLGRRKEIFKPIRKEWVGLYTCGPTVYNYAHIGNLRTYIFEDVLRRTLEYAGYKVKHVMNITDVGHLTSDADSGEDKLDREAKKEGRSVWDIAKFYTRSFLKDIERLHVKKANYLLPATQTVNEQIKIILKLFENGYAYETPQAIYFDVSKFKNYTKLSRQKLSQKILGARAEVIVDSDKKSPYDFALWFKLAGRFKNHSMYWSSPWGKGFPGWHIECSAISTKYLGQPFDIHTGGVDHISVHHTNEIAQSEAAYKKPLARYWLHGEFLLINAGKMAKSEGNFITLDTLTKKGFNLLAFRYLVLTAHYRSKLNFTWKSLEAAQNSLERIYEFIREIKTWSRRNKAQIEHKISSTKHQSFFQKALFEDLDTPQGLAVLWELIHAYNQNPSGHNPKDVLKLIYNFDEVLGLEFKKIKSEKIPQEILDLSKKRENYRKEKKWLEADRIRDRIRKLGYNAKDTSSGAIISKK